MKKEEIAELFTEKLCVPAPADPVQLTALAREVLRERFLTARVGTPAPTSWSPRPGPS
jgi:L-lactate utilization protein LutB